MMGTKPDGRFAAWVEAEMQRRGISERQMARYAGAAPTTVGNWRKASAVPTPASLWKLAHVPGTRTTFEELMQLAGHLPPNAEVKAAETEIVIRGPEPQASYLRELAALSADQLQRAVMAIGMFYSEITAHREANGERQRNGGEHSPAAPA